LKNTFKVSVVQHTCSKDYNVNIERSLSGIREASQNGANIVLLPELNSLPYFCIDEDTANFDLAESVPGPTTDRLGQNAREFGLIIITTVFEKRARGIYHNTAVVLDTDGSLAGTYRKMHIPDDPGFYEKFYFTPGDQGFLPVETSIGKLGVLICWDQWFPEAARLMALAGAECLFYPSAIGWEPDENEQEKVRQRNAWITIQKAHAVANNLPVVVSNRLGRESGHSESSPVTEFWGSSFIAGQQGETLAKAPIDQAVVISAEINPDRTDTVRRIWPYFRDRRIDAYQGLTKRLLDA
jgi:N-carbamoylputrescine amidase